jgi:hypothetical protein
MFDNSVEIGFTAANNDVVVGMNAAGTLQAVWSSDGKHFQYGTGVTANIGPIASMYSPERHEFYTPGNPGFYSSDGKTWTQAEGKSPDAFAGLWVGNGINGYYVASPDTAGNYSLYYAPDPHTDFVNSQLDGAIIANNSTYNCVAFRSYNSSFIVALYNNTYQLAYSTARPFAIKSVSDQIRVRGFPVSVGCYSTYADATCNNTTAETIISSPAAIGTLTFQADQQLGEVFKFLIVLALTSAAGDTLTIRYKVNGTTVFSHVIMVPALSVSLPCRISSGITVRSGSIQVWSDALVSDVSDFIALVGVAYNNNQANTWSITAQWGANVNQLVVSQLYVEAVFPNGG